MADYDPTPPIPEGESGSPINPTTVPPSGTGATSSGGVVVSNVSRTLDSVSIYALGSLPITDPTAPKANYLLVGSYTGNSAFDQLSGRFRVTLNAADVDDGIYNLIGTNPEAQFDQGWGENQIVVPIALTADNNNYGWQSRVKTDADAYSTASLLYFKTAPIAAYLYLPTVSAVTDTTASIACLFYANTYHSLCNARLQYKAASSGTWVTAGATAPCNGYDQKDIGRDLTGLTERTVYNVRLALSREVAGGTVETYSDTLTFVTNMGAVWPTPTTLAATSIGESSAILNGALSKISQANVPYSFLYGLANPPTTEVGISAVDVTSIAYVNYKLTGLAESTLYYFRLKAGDTSPDYGSVLSFTTTPSQETQAKEDDMLPIQTFDRKYGVETYLYFVVPSPSPDSNTLYTGAAPWAAGESKITTWIAPDTSTGPTDTTYLPTQVSGPIYKLRVAAGELAFDEVFITLIDTGVAARNVLLRVRTQMELGTVVVDAVTGTRTNASAMKLSGHGSGAGLEAIGGATGVDIDAVLASNFLHVGTAGTQHTVSNTQILLGTSSSNTADLYNGCLIGITGGTGAGQSRLILDYVGGTYPSGATNDGNHEATVDTAWTTNPDNTSIYAITPGPRTWEQAPTAELAGVPTTASGYGAFLQLLFQRFAFKITQDSTTQKWYKANGTTELLNRPVSDTGGVQTVGTLATT